jgi:hypothetical protein
MASPKLKTNITTFRPKPKKKRKGIVSKNKASKIKTSKNYVKRYAGQGR